MCILLSTTEHPNFPFVLLSNRDEFFVRPTQKAHFRPLPDNNKILTPLDLARPEHGTWMGVTTSGRIAVLVNYREDPVENFTSDISRGVLPLSFLKANLSDEEWYETLLSGLSRNSSKRIELSMIGGFTLYYGTLRIDPETKTIEPLNILSNRSERGQVHISKGLDKNLIHKEIAYKTTFGLSNSIFYKPWPKVELGERLLSELVADCIKSKFSQEQFVEKCFKILSINSFDKNIADHGSYYDKLEELKNSILIPPLDIKLNQSDANDSRIGKYYGTRTQSVILLDKFGNLHYYEKNLHTSDELIPSEGINLSHFKFNINTQQQNVV